MTDNMKSFVKMLLCGLVSKGVVSEKTPIAYSYNGVVLPKLPEWDKEAYPYAFIGSYDFLDLGGFYHAFMMKTPLYAYEVTDSGEIFSDYHDDMSPDALAYELINGEWVENGRPDFLFSLSFSMIWANYDVVLVDSTTVVLAASNPIPVYGGDS